MQIVSQTSITAYPLAGRGKVRDIYEIDNDSLLIVTTDRMSAFDVILPSPVPYKGVILNQLTLFWMKKFEDIVPNHILESDIDHFPDKLAPWREELEGRSVIVRKARPLPIECIVRGYLAGSGWKEYQKNNEVDGISLQAGLREADKLESPIFTPSTKAELGQHDENITFYQAEAMIGDEAAKLSRFICLDLYEKGSTYALAQGIIIADTKFELGFIDGKLHLIDEVLTPDSSRFWPKDLYHPGQSQPSYDKQFLRDWLNTQAWNHKPPAPLVPEDIIKKTAEKYQEAYELLLKKKL